MNPDVKKLLESEVLSEETQSFLAEAWEQKLKEAREEITAELREEFANRYEHDRQNIVEASNKMIQESLKEEIDSLVKQRKSLAEAKNKLDKERKKVASEIKEHMYNVLKEEMSEFKADRKAVFENLKRLKEHMHNVLKEELTEFKQDKDKLVEARVKLERDKKESIKEARKEFVSRASKVVENITYNTLKTELSQLKEDINECKKKNFGTKIFEAFAAEYMNSHYNENSNLKKLSKVLEAKDNKLKEATQHIQSQKKVLDEARAEAKRANSLRERQQILSTLLSPLGRKQKEVMHSLLESVPNNKLEASYKKYLPAVINENENTNNSKRMLSENKTNTNSSFKEFSGDRPVNKDDDSFLDDIRRYAGIK